MNRDQLLAFNKQIIQQETPVLLRKLLGYDQIDSDETLLQ